MTQQQIKDFQKKYGLVVDGILGPKTRAAMEALKPKVFKGLNMTSMNKLTKVHPDLVKVVLEAAKSTTVPFIITCGIRTIAEQRILVASGASKTMRSRHLPGAKTKLSHAVDLAAVVNGKARYDWPLYHQLAFAMKVAARELGTPLEWGGDWKTFKDGPHFQLPWNKYPG